MKKIYNAPLNLKSQSAGEISCVFATMQVWDHDNDYTERGAFGTQEHIILEGWNHAYMQLPVGQGRVFEKGTDAIFEGTFFLDTTAGRDHYETLRQMDSHEYPQEFSYSFDIVKSENVDHNGRSGRRLINLKVLGVAPVTRGAGLNTRLLHLKSADGTWLPVGLSPANVRRQLEAMIPPRELGASIDAEISRMQSKAFSDLQARLKQAGGPSILQIWRDELLAEGNSPNWVETVLAIEVYALAWRLELNSYAPLHEPGWALKEALRILNAPPRQDATLTYPEIGGNATSPLVFR